VGATSGDAGPLFLPPSTTIQRCPGNSDSTA